MPVKQIVEDFARYPYLPRVSGSALLLKSIGDGTGLLTWEHDAFAFADSFDDDSERYRDLRAGQLVDIEVQEPGIRKGVGAWSAARKWESTAATPSGLTGRLSARAEFPRMT